VFLGQGIGHGYIGFVNHGGAVSAFCIERDWVTVRAHQAFMNGWKLKLHLPKYRCCTSCCFVLCNSRFCTCYFPYCLG
jgi:hypothetical protein